MVLVPMSEVPGLLVMVMGVGRRTTSRVPATVAYGIPSGSSSPTR
jgi:hypothetical protein